MHLPYPSLHLATCMLIAGTQPVSASVTKTYTNGENDTNAYTGNVTLTVNGTDSATQSGNLSGNGDVTKDGTGTLTLSGTNSKRGGGDLLAGTLIVNGSLSLTAGSLAVYSGATLGGNGTLGGRAPHIFSGAHLAPGNTSPGTITFTNGLYLNPGAFLDLRLGTTSDKIAVTGDVLTGPTSGTITVNLSDSGGFTADTYTLIDLGAVLDPGFGASDFVLGTLISGTQLSDYSFALNGSLLQLTFIGTVIPEPASTAVAAALLALGGTLWVRSRRPRAA